MKKLYYSIGEVSKITQVEPHVLRYWETLFDDLTPRKNRAGNRTYSKEDIETILRLKELIQVRKYSTAGAKRELERKDESESLPNTPLPAHIRRDLQELRILLKEISDSL
ncbi:MAG: MerR family transcriptional regulator [Bacteroidota bacterium]